MKDVIFPDFPKTQLEFETRFSTEDACRSYLISQRWPDGFRCPSCSHHHGWTNKRYVIECSACHHQTSLTAGTILEGTRKPLRMWFIAMWWVCTQKTGGSAAGLQRLLGLGSYKTAWTWLHKVRTAMIRTDREKLSGKVHVIPSIIFPPKLINKMTRKVGENNVKIEVKLPFWRERKVLFSPTNLRSIIPYFQEPRAPSNANSIAFS